GPGEDDNDRLLVAEVAQSNFAPAAVFCSANVSECESDGSSCFRVCNLAGKSDVGKENNCQRRQDVAELGHGGNSGKTFPRRSAHCNAFRATLAAACWSPQNAADQAPIAA